MSLVYGSISTQLCDQLEGRDLDGLAGCGNSSETTCMDL